MKIFGTEFKLIFSKMDFFPKILVNETKRVNLHFCEETLILNFNLCFVIVL